VTVPRFNRQQAVCQECAGFVGVEDRTRIAGRGLQVIHQHAEQILDELLVRRVVLRFRQREAVCETAIEEALGVLIC
jgi:hypothetical protein